MFFLFPMVCALGTIANKVQDPLMTPFEKQRVQRFSDERGVMSQLIDMNRQYSKMLDNKMLSEQENVPPPAHLIQKSQAEMVPSKTQGNVFTKMMHHEIKPNFGLNNFQFGLVAFMLILCIINIGGLFICHCIICCFGSDVWYPLRRVSGMSGYS